MSLTHHDGLSVYGSGLWVGKRPDETLVMNCSGELVRGTNTVIDISGQFLAGGGTTVIDTSGFIQNGRLTQAGGTVGLKIDGGTVGFSGWFLRSQSTGLSTIITIVATVDVNNVMTSGLSLHTSGGKTIIDTTFSGHCYDMWKSVMLSGSNVGGVIGVSSGQTSSKINWMAIGT